MAAQPNNFDYLLQAQELAEDNALDLQEFYKVNMGGSNDTQDDATGAVIEAKKYNAKNFPGFNYDEIFVIPLLMFPKRRVLYSEKYSGSSRPPSCVSNDGIRSNTPGNSVMGKTMDFCTGCHFARFQANPGCLPRPEIYGLALFNEGGELRTYPVKLDIPTTSRQAVEGIVLGVNRGVDLLGDGSMVSLPYFTRVIKLGRTLKTTNSGPVTAWTMKLLGPDSEEVDPHEKKPLPNFTPKHILDGIKELMDVARAQVQAYSTPLPQLTGSRPAGLLPGGIPATGGSIDAAGEISASVDDF